MNDRPPPLATTPVRLFLALAAAMLFSWPVISIAGAHGVFAMFDYVFAVWALLVVLLVFVGRACAREHTRPPE